MTQIIFVDFKLFCQDRKLDSRKCEISWINVYLNFSFNKSKPGMWRHQNFSGVSNSLEGDRMSFCFLQKYWLNVNKRPFFGIRSLTKIKKLTTIQIIPYFQGRKCYQEFFLTLIFVAFGSKDSCLKVLEGFCTLRTLS